jgi:hypothetical protein
MFGKLSAAALAAFLIASPEVAAQAATADKKATTQPAAEKTPPAAEKKLTPQQQKMKDCSAKWKDEKATKKVSGKKAHNAFMSTCLKG